MVEPSLSEAIDAIVLAVRRGEQPPAWASQIYEDSAIVDELHGDFMPYDRLPNWGRVIPSDLDLEIEEGRLDKLAEGAPPTEAENRLLKEAQIAWVRRISADGDGMAYAFTTLIASDGNIAYCVHVLEGYAITTTMEIFGYYESKAACVEALSQVGVVLPEIPAPESPVR
jgi:hypothetical protein